MANEITTFQEMKYKAEAIVKSGFCGFTKPEEVITLALVAQDEGRSIGSVARDYHIIKGRPTLKADSMLARFQAAGGKVQWTSLTDKRCSAIFTHEQCGTFELEWTIEQAKAAGLTSNATWSKYPRAMLRARVISEGIRTALPACLSGVYTPEEVRDMDYEEKNAQHVEAVVVDEKPAKAMEVRPIAAHVSDEPGAYELQKFKDWEEAEKIRVGYDLYGKRKNEFEKENKLFTSKANMREFMRIVKAMPDDMRGKPEPENPDQEEMKL